MESLRFIFFQVGITIRLRLELVTNSRKLEKFVLRTLQVLGFKVVHAHFFSKLGLTIFHEGIPMNIEHRIDWANESINNNRTDCGARHESSKALYLIYEPRKRS